MAQRRKLKVPVMKYRSGYKFEGPGPGSSDTYRDYNAYSRTGMPETRAYRMPSGRLSGDYPVNSREDMKPGGGRYYQAALKRDKKRNNGRRR